MSRKGAACKHKNVFAPTMTSSAITKGERFSWIGFSISGHSKFFYDFSKLLLGICMQLAMILYLKYQSQELLNWHLETTSLTNDFLAPNIALSLSCLDLEGKILSGCFFVKTNLSIMLSLWTTCKHFILLAVTSKCRQRLIKSIIYYWKISDVLLPYITCAPPNFRSI